MFVSQIMTSPVVTVTAGTSIKAAARVLRDRDVAAAPVVDDAGALVGIVSELDLLRGCWRPTRSPTCCRSRPTARRRRRSSPT